MPKEFQARTDEMFSLDDSVTSYIGNKLSITNDSKDYIRRGQLFEDYKAYCNDNSQRCKPRSTFFKRMDDLKIQISKKDGYDVYRGLALKQMTQKQSDDDEGKAEYVRAEEFTKLQRIIEKTSDKMEMLEELSEDMKTYIHQLEKIVNKLEDDRETVYADNEDNEDNDDNEDNEEVDEPINISTTQKEVDDIMDLLSM